MVQKARVLRLSTHLWTKYVIVYSRVVQPTSYLPGGAWDELNSKIWYQVEHNIWYRVPAIPCMRGYWVGPLYLV